MRAERQRPDLSDPLDVLRAAERSATQRGETVLAVVFRVAAVNVWAHGAPCAGECDDLHCEYARPTIALARERLRTF